MTPIQNFKIHRAIRPVSLGAGQRSIGGGEPVICVPLVANDPQAAVEQARRLGSSKADLIEVRLDFLQNLTIEETAPLFIRFKHAGQLPLLATCRRVEEGGAQRLDEAQRLGLLRAAVVSGAVSLVDVEYATGQAARQEFLDFARQNGVASIVSHHDFETTPDFTELLSLLTAMAATGADIVKLAVMPHSPEDTLELLRATLAASQSLPVPVVTMAMGPLGSFTRLAGPFFGSTLSFAVGENSSAPGQINLDLMQDLWENWLVRS